MRVSPTALAALSLLIFTPLFSRAAVVASPDDEAQFLAGMSVPMNSPLEPLTHAKSYIAYAKDFDTSWGELEKHQLTPIAEWAPGNLDHFYTDHAPLLYFFSGPDFLYAHAFFPNATTYVMCGIEPIGPLPAAEYMAPEVMGTALGTLRESMDSLLDFSFFITKKMKVQLTDNRLSGTLPIIYIFLARTGCHITAVTFTAIDTKGYESKDRTAAPGVRIDFVGPGGKAQVLYYFSTDLSDGPVDHSGFLKWCANLGESRGFLKAASYLMHSSGFDTSRKFLLSDCSAILQDDSGVPIRYLQAENWDIHLFGNYAGPIDSFKKYAQPEIDQLKVQQKPLALPFSIGYRWHPGQSSLILAIRPGH
jgi:hypothetical protein